jgi:hypothetical protein
VSLRYIFLLSLFFCAIFADKNVFHRIALKFTPTPIDAHSSSTHNARNNHAATNRDSVEPSAPAVGRQYSSPPEKN